MAKKKSYLIGSTKHKGKDRLTITEMGAAPSKKVKRYTDLYNASMGCVRDARDFLANPDRIVHITYPDGRSRNGWIDAVTGRVMLGTFKAAK